MAEERSLMTGADLMARYSISDMTLHRWIRNKDLNFPQPLVINRRRFFNSEEIQAWEASRKGAAA